MKDDQQLINQILQSIQQIVDKCEGYTIDVSLRNENYKPNILRKEKNKIICINVKLEKELI